MDQITLKSRIRQNADRFLGSPLGDGMILMDMQKGNYISLNTTALQIWEHADKTIEVNEMIALFTRTFNVSRELCEADTLACINAMHHQDLLLLADI